MKNQRPMTAIALAVVIWVRGTPPAAASLPLPRLQPLGTQRAVAASGRAARSSADPHVTTAAAALRTAHRNLADRRAARARATPAQGSAIAELRDRMQTAIDVRLRSPDGTPRFVHGECLERGHGNWLDGDQATARGFLRVNRGLLRLDDPDTELVLQAQHADALGRRQLRFGQRHRGVPVWPAELIVHLNEAGNVDTMDGAFAATPVALDVEPQRDRDAVVALARAAVPDGAATDVGEATLVVYPRPTGVPRLAWRVRLVGALHVRWLVVVDDRDGEILSTITEAMDVDVAGSGLDLFGRSQNLRVWREEGVHYLVDTSKPMFDPSSNPPGPNATRGAIVVLDAQNQASNNGSLSLAQITAVNANGNWLRDGVSAAFGLGQTFDYFSAVHGRNSLDGRGGNILGVVRYDRNFQNAFWNGQLMVFGDGAPYAGALDVVAHELAHGVTQHSANLVYQNQPGALNEAMSDVFGEATEARTVGSNDWLLGASLGEPLRDMMDPHRLRIGNTGRVYPKTFSELIRPNDPFLDQFDNRDSGGVHLNSSIINHGFYQLAEGLPGAIGIVDAARVFYRALTAHLVTQSEFVDARLAAVRSAQELFGADDVRVQRVREAFDAVGIADGNGNPPPSPFPGTEGEDSLLFLYSDQETSERYLGRRETALGDGPSGVRLGTRAAALRRPAVTGNGETAAYVTTGLVVCFVDTDDPSSESCTDGSQLFNSIALSPDGQFAGVVLSDGSNPQDEIIVLGLADGGGTTTYPLRAPSYDDGSFDTVAFASEMDFSANNRLLVYDAFNEVNLVGEDPFTAWSVYALDIANDVTYVIVQPSSAVDVGNPSMAQRSDDHVVLDAFSTTAGESTIIAGVLSTGAATEVGTVQGNVGAPGYAGDDSGVVFSHPDTSAPSGASLFRQAVGADRTTPVGGPSNLLTDGYFGIVYRRGTFSGPPACPSDAACDDGDACTTDRCDPAAGCSNTPKTGGSRALCLYPSPQVGSACDGGAGFPAIEARLEAARRKFERSESASRPKQARAQLRQGLKLLNKSQAVARRLARKGKVSAECSEAVASFVAAVRGGL